MTDADTLLEISNLSVEYTTAAGIVKALDRVDMKLKRSEFLGLVGESGSGKSTLAYATIGLLSSNARITSGQIIFDGKNLMKLSQAEMRSLRGARISMVFQDPMTSLNPVFKIEEQICRVIELHKGVGKQVAKTIALQHLTQVELPDSERILKSYPFELSGGMQQRVMIAMALSMSPDLVIADEPTSAVDATIQFQILELLTRLRKTLGFSMLFITHNLDVVGQVCDRVAVMYAGRIVEEGPTQMVLKNPKHPYTQALIKSIPRPRKHSDEDKHLSVIEGSIPDMTSPPKGCKFHPRCPYAFSRCEQEEPELKQVEDDRMVACHLY
ncbi:MAG: ABC transporter ATP-binding protein [Conexivisphaerales archaeon]